MLYTRAFLILLKLDYWRKKNKRSHAQNFATMCSKNLKLGTKISINSNVGIIRYIGNIPEKEGVWVGIEWDDLKLGKHDGTIDGIRYFKTSKQNASFLPLINIESKIMYGQSCVKAFEERYGIKDDKLLLNLLSKQNVDVIGFDEITSRLKDLNLSIVDLSYQNINCSCNHDSLSTFLPNVEQLNVSHNLITSFAQIIHMIKNMKRLKQLDISFNLIEFNDTTIRNITVKKLIANYTHLNWEGVFKLLKIFSNTCELHIADNELKELDIDKNAGPFSSIILLDLQNNDDIYDWHRQVLPLATLFPNLEILYLNNTGPYNYNSMLSTDSIQKFNNLKALHLKNCFDMFDHVSHITPLSIYLGSIAPNLTSFSFSATIYRRNLGIPNVILLDVQKASYTTIIACMPGLSKFNGTTITPTDRRTAEMFLLNNFIYSHKAACEHQKYTDKIELVFTELLHKYEHEVLQYTGVVPEPDVNSLEADLIRTTFIYGNVRITKNILRQTPIGKLLLVAIALFKIPQKLSLDLMLYLRAPSTTREAIRFDHITENNNLENINIDYVDDKVENEHIKIFDENNNNNYDTDLNENLETYTYYKGDFTKLDQKCKELSHYIPTKDPDVLKPLVICILIAPNNQQFT